MNEETTIKPYLIPVNGLINKALAVEDFMTIGSDSANKIVLNDDTVSERHARIEKRAQGFTLRDLQSKTGTFVNGSRVIEAILNEKDQISFGDCSFFFTQTDLVETRPKSLNLIWDEQLKRLPALALSSFPVLLSGPSGTGKDILARWLHEHSARNNAPMIAINCSALSENLIESELFGHIKGSFTGAMNDRKGAFESARGGTLFLD